MAILSIYDVTAENVLTLTAGECVVLYTQADFDCGWQAGLIYDQGISLLSPMIFWAAYSYYQFHLVVTNQTWFKPNWLMGDVAVALARRGMVKSPVVALGERPNITHYVV